ncbi:MAG: cytochrome C, partial [Burkholderia sp.]|nr:cytochrome C [Burkholderia sp.]
MIDRTMLIRRARATLLGAAWLPALAFAATPQDAPAAASAAAIAPAATASAARPFTPPPESAIPADDFGKTVRLGEQIFLHTPEFAGKYVGNK